MPTEIIVFSHLRWDWVWQRPQQIISRLPQFMNARIWFVEEPMASAGDDIRHNVLVTEDVGPVTRVWLKIADPGHHVGFSDEVLAQYAAQLPQLIGSRERERIVWLYTPLAIDVANKLSPSVLVYDVMDDLASFDGAASELVSRQEQALLYADIVFAGGRSLHTTLNAKGRTDAELLPSGVDVEHYASAKRDKSADRSRPVAGYVGVVDERLDLGLLGALARALPEWTIRVIGPLAKIDPADLPDAPNIEYLGQMSYNDLPSAMGGFDVALMPFALNEATRSISPTKTLEYLAAGLPVVSTRIADVIADFGGVVELRDDAVGFAEACRESLRSSYSDALELDSLFVTYSWNGIAQQMAYTITSKGLDSGALQTNGRSHVGHSPAGPAGRRGTAALRDQDSQVVAGAATDGGH
ncbi:MAG: hypothetical protein JWQ43_1488 [Glaciihabitans sp.]|nr:hypothetical protein [Glaciihabitans sp.]